MPHTADALTVALFSKTMSDDDWVTCVRPLVELITSQVDDVNSALEGDSESRESMFRRVIAAFPTHRKMLRSVPQPSSKDARQARQTLDLALQDYIDGAMLGRKAIQDSGKADTTTLGGRTLIASAKFRKDTAVFAFENAQKRLTIAMDFFIRRGVAQVRR